MDPTTVFCPHLACPARGQIGQGTIGIHARQDKRFLCPVCRQTFSATTGPAFDRLRTAAEPVARVVPVRAHGCPVHAMVAALGCDERPVADGWARSGEEDPRTPAQRLRLVLQCTVLRGCGVAV